MPSQGSGVQPPPPGQGQEGSSTHNFVSLQRCHPSMRTHTQMCPHTHHKVLMPLCTVACSLMCTDVQTYVDPSCIFMWICTQGHKYVCGAPT